MKYLHTFALHQKREEIDAHWLSKKKTKHINSDLKHVWGVFYPEVDDRGVEVLTPGYDKQIETFSLKYNHLQLIVKRCDKIGSGKE